MEHRPELDGIRAFAVLAVIAFHAGIKPATGGWLGVDIFFVLSGYLITAILLRERAKTGDVDLRKFWIRRLLRLYPALVVTLVLGTLFYKTLGDGGTFGGWLKTAASAGAYVENLVWAFSNDPQGELGHTWSLAVEMQFYLVWPALLVWIIARGWNLQRVLLAGIMVSYLLFLLQSGSPPTGYYTFADSYYLPWTRAFELLLGAWVAWKLQGAGTRRERGGRHWVGWLIGFGYAVVLYASWTDSIFLRPQALQWESPAAALLTVALLLHLDRVRTEGVGKLLAWRPVAWIGLVSYGVYLFHLPVIVLLREKADITEAKVIFILALPITLALAAASYYAVERPALRMKDRYASRPTTTTAG